MGYNLHITRREMWCDEGKDITVDEWIGIVENDPELSIDSKNGLYFAVWKPRHMSEEYWLDWFQGNIYSKNPDQALILKMIEISKQLRAVVQGDDGEIYNDIKEQQGKPIMKKKMSWIERFFRG